MEVYMQKIKIILLSVLFVATVTSALYSKSLVDKGVMEIKGTSGLSGGYTSGDDFDSFGLSLYADVNYYAIGNLHIGLGTGFRYFKFLNHEGLDSSNISVSPRFSIGYTLNISEKLYFDIAPFIGISILRRFGEYANDDPTKILDSGLNLLLKYDLGGAVVNFGVTQVYSDVLEHRGHSTYSASAVFGLSVYF